MTTAIDYPFAAPTVASRWPPASALTTLRAAVNLLRKTVRNGFAAARRSREHRALRALDDATLRDLGVHVSEISSYLAEAAGEAEVTRLRIACAAGAPLGRSLNHL
jgi:uncharacterized protein YjiS (DUF1127 family)